MLLSRIPILALVALAASPAQAADRMAVLVKGTGTGSDMAAAFVSHYAKAAIDTDSRYELIDLVAALRSPSRDRATRAFTKARQEIAQGKEAFETLELDQGAQLLTSALAKFERHAAYVTNLVEVGDALMLLGATYILSGQDGLGVQRLAQALAINPEAQADPHIFNPGMRDIFEQVRGRQVSQAEGGLNVSSTPGYSRVYVDGRFAGVTPTALAGLAAGRHYVRVEKDGLRNWGTVIDVRAGFEASAIAALKPTASAADFANLLDGMVGSMKEAADDPQRPIDDAIEQAGVLLAIDHLLLLNVELVGEKITINAHQYDLNARRLTKSAAQTFAYGTDASLFEKETNDLVDRAFGPKTLHRPDNALGDADGTLLHAGKDGCYGMDCRKFKKVVTITSASLGGVGIASGIALWVSANNKKNEFQRRAQLDPQHDELRSSGKARALTGDIVFTLGVALAAAAPALYFFWQPAPSASDVLEAQAWRIDAVPHDDGASVLTTWRF